MKKKNITFAILLMAVMVTAFNVSKTYARYTTTEEGTATATVAKWAVLIKGDEETDSTETFEIALDEEEENQYVVEGVIAPDKTIYGDLEIDLGGTQVATDIDVVVDEEEIATIVGDATRFSVSIVPVIDEVEGTELTLVGGKATIAYTDTGWDGEAAYAEGSPLTVRVKLTWENDESSNENDTTMGENAGTITVPITVTAKQHIAEDDTVEP